MTITWKLETLPFNLPLQLINQLSAYPINLCPNHIPDKDIWKLTKDGNFTFKSTYNFIISKGINDQNFTPCEPPKLNLGLSPITLERYYSYGMSSVKVSPQRLTSLKLIVP